MRNPTVNDWLILVALGLVWGCAFLAIKYAVLVFTPLQMASWRMVLAWLVYIPVALTFWSKINWRKWPVLLGVAFFGSAIPNFLFAVAQQHVNSGLAGTLNSLTPLFTLSLGALFFSMPVSRNKFLGVALGFAGTLLLIWLNTKGGFGGNVFYIALCVLATVCYATNANLLNSFMRGEHPGAVTSASFMLTGWLFLIPLWQSGGFQAAVQSEAGMRGLGIVFFLAAISTVLGSIVYFWLLQRTNAVFATSVTYLLPIVSLLLGMLDGEQLSPMDLVATGVILLGVYLARK